jgi:hypothetical protein
MAQRCRRLLRNPHQATLKRGIFYSVANLRAAINRFLDDHDAESKPFEWTADPDKIIAAVRRGRQMSDSIRWAPPRGLRPHMRRRSGDAASRVRVARQTSSGVGARPSLEVKIARDVGAALDRPFLLVSGDHDAKTEVAPFRQRPLD